MKIFLLGTSADPAYGGPAYSVTGLAMALAGAGGDVGLWTPDRSGMTTPLLPPEAGVSRLDGTIAEALARFGRPDVIHDNGLWRLHNHRLAALAAARGIPRVVSTRGMLEPWARNHKKRRKHLAWHAYQRRDLMRAGCLHATSEHEAEHLRNLRLSVPVRMIPNGIDLLAIERNDPKSWRPMASDGKRIALFLGRLYPVKGLPLLIDAWSRVRPFGWRLVIAGPDEARHQALVERMVDRAGLNDVVSFTGPLDGEAKREAFTGASLFVLPTLSESFGVAILEALAHGIPVLTTVRAPWPMLADRGCGWSVEPTIDGVAEGLRTATALDVRSLQSMGAKGRDLAARFAWHHVAGEFLSLYDDLAAPRGRRSAKYVSHVG